MSLPTSSLPAASAPVGQPRVRRLLSTALRSGRVPHALLFVGPEGCGKETFALALASALLCQASENHEFGCGACDTCRRVVRGVHPDVHLVLAEVEAIRRGLAEPEGKKRPSLQIRIAQVRELARQMRMRPYEAEGRVAIVRDASRMNDNAQNALLKTLEEPGASSTLILTAPHERALLPTIVSRCARIRFAPLDVETLTQLLEREGIADASSRAALADGSVTVARGLDPQEGTAAEALLDGLLAPDPQDRLDAIESMGRDREEVGRQIVALEAAMVRRARNSIEQGETGARPFLRALEAYQDLREGLEVNANLQLALEEVFILRAE